MAHLTQSGGLASASDFGSCDMLAILRPSSRPDTPDEDERTLDFLEVLTETIEAVDQSISSHGRRVSLYARWLAERVDLDGHERERVRIGAFLHDLGKVGVPSDLLAREGALAPHERRVVQQHPEIGARLVRPLGLHCDLTHAIRHHHEWWNGAGYPDGLAGESIPCAARIVSIADAFDAMTTDRPYRAALPRDLVLDELVRFAGVQFDPALTAEFVDLIASHPAAGARTPDPALGAGRVAA